MWRGLLRVGQYVWTTEFKIGKTGEHLELGLVQEKLAEAAWTQLVRGTESSLYSGSVAEIYDK